MDTGSVELILYDLLHKKKRDVACLQLGEPVMDPPRQLDVVKYISKMGSEALILAKRFCLEERHVTRATILRHGGTMAKTQR